LSKGAKFTTVGRITSLLDQAEYCRGRFPLWEAESCFAGRIFLCVGLDSFKSGLSSSFLDEFPDQRDKISLLVKVIFIVGRSSMLRAELLVKGGESLD
jgi:hypothetical protein